MPEIQTIKNTELNNLVKRTVLEVVQETLADSDFGLELRESIKKRLQKKPKKLVSFEEIKRKYC